MRDSDTGDKVSRVLAEGAMGECCGAYWSSKKNQCDRPKMKMAALVR